MSEQPNREKEIFNLTLEMGSPEARLAFVSGACGPDHQLRERVETLLKAYESAGGFIPNRAGIAEEIPTVITPVKLTEGPGTVIDRYKLLQMIGEGGFGAVYIAEQKEPVKRRVALKIIKLGMDTRQVVARFEAERQALALMDHPNIAKVLDAGATESGRPYFAMELVRGVPITQDRDDNNLLPTERLQLFMHVCHAIQHAHQKGLIHRDIKPSNILVTLHDGVPVPKVIDFGIAKATQQELTEKTVFTQFQQFIGTPAYMSPEQAEMSGLDIDTRSDIYSLGVLLYELLTGKTPFDAKALLASGLDEIRRKIREEEPVRPSTRVSTMADAEQRSVAKHRQSNALKLIHLLRGDLDWIVMKCLEKDRTRRYETANGLVAEIERHLKNEPVVARPPSNFYRVQKLIRRNKLTFAALAAVLSVLVLGAAVSTWQAIRATRAERAQSRLYQDAEKARWGEAIQRQQAEEARKGETKLRQQAEVQELAARQTAYNSDMNLAQQALQLNNVGRASEVLNRHRPKPAERDLRGWEWRYLWQSCQSDALFTLCRQSNDIFSVAFAKDGKFLAVSDDSSEVTVWDVLLRKRIFSRKTQVKRQRLSYSPVSDRLAICVKGADGQFALTLWDAKFTERLRVSLPGEAREMVFSGDGTIIATWCSQEAEPRILLWDSDSGRKLSELSAPRATSYEAGNLLALSYEGQTLAYGTKGGEIVAIDVASRAEKLRIAATTEITMAVAISNDGRTLASAAGFTEPFIKLWDLNMGTEVARLEGHRSYVNSLAFSPDGRLLASASGDQTIRLWDWKAKQPVATLRGHLLEVLDVAFSPDGQTLASGCKDGSVFIWKVALRHSESNYALLPAPVSAWTFTPDSKEIIGLDKRGAVRSWASANLYENQKFTELSTNNTSFALSNSGILLAVGDQSGQVRVINLSSVREAGTFAAGRGVVTVIGFSANEELLFAYDTNRAVSIWDVRSCQLRHRWQIDERFDHFSLAPAADVLATGRDGQLILWKTMEGHRVSVVKVQDELWDISFSHDGKMLATASAKGPVKLFDSRTGHELATLTGFLLGTHSVVFSHDDKRLAIGSNGKEAIKLWDAQLLQEVLTLEGQGFIFEHTAFSSDGRMIGSANLQGILHLWRAPSWTEIEAAEKAEAKAQQP